MKKDYEKMGYLMVQDVIKKSQLNFLVNLLSAYDKEINHYGIRDLMNKLPQIRELALSMPLLSIAKQILGNNAQPIRALYFDKSADANWNVAWHQDTSITVKKKITMPGFSSWRKKQGVVHVEPPANYLSNIVALRIHLDPSNTQTGVLRVLPESHKDGRVNSNAILTKVAKSTAIECTASPGDVLLMNPLLFHSSRKATQPKHRRIIHLEYSALSLPTPLEWYESAY